MSLSWLRVLKVLNWFLKFPSQILYVRPNCGILLSMYISDSTENSVLILGICMVPNTQQALYVVLFFSLRFPPGTGKSCEWDAVWLHVACTPALLNRWDLVIDCVGGLATDRMGMSLALPLSAQLIRDGPVEV